jgi:SNF2 family DNA or RNA helicase
MRKSQQHAAQFILNNKKCALHLPVGFGKTRATIHALDNLTKQKDRSILIVAPKLVTYHTWPEELKKCGEFLKEVDVIIIDDTKKKREKQLSMMKGSALTLCNVEKLSWLIGYWSLKGKWPYDIIVLDESSLFKNGSSERFKALKCVLPYTDRIIELTGTPMPRDPMDLWSQIYILDNGKRLGKYKTHYQQNFLQPDLRTYSAQILHRSRGIVRKWEFAKKGQVLNTISDICFSLKPEDVDYPDVNIKTIELNLDQASLDAYKKLSRDYILQVKESNSDPIEVIIKTQAILNGKLRHVCNGALYDTEQNIIRLHDQKADSVKEIIQTEGNFLLAYHFKSDWDQIKDKIKIARHIKEDGAIDEWNEGNIKLLCAQVQSASHGLNLQSGGNNIIWFGVNYDLERYEQFNGRLCRPGQSRPVNIYHIIMKYPSGSIEQDIMGLLEIRKTEQISVIDYITKKTLERLNNGNL